MKNKGIETQSRKAAFALLKNFCPFSAKDDAHYIEVVWWFNGEGVDVIIEDSSGEESFSLTYGQYDALKACMQELGA